MYFGTARIASSVVRMTIGSMRNDERQRGGQHREADAHALDEERQAEQAHDDRRHAASESAAKRIVRTSRPWTAYSAR